MPAPNRTVVVVEDDALMRAAVHSVLDARGYHAVAYDNAEAAFAGDALAEARCAILDVALPGMSGIELCRRMRVAGLATPVILVTARDARHLRKDADELGVIALMVKPFSGRRLAHLVDLVGPRDPTRRAEAHDAH
jgi:DNA-binding response OmpR family regulator